MLKNRGILKKLNPKIWPARRQKQIEAINIVQDTFKFLMYGDLSAIKFVSFSSVLERFDVNCLSCDNYLTQKFLT